MSVIFPKPLRFPPKVLRRVINKYFTLLIYSFHPQYCQSRISTNAFNDYS